jgi:hypothetical protein
MDQFVTGVWLLGAKPRTRAAYDSLAQKHADDRNETPLRLNILFGSWRQVISGPWLTRCHIYFQEAPSFIPGHNTPEILFLVRSQHLHKLTEQSVPFCNLVCVETLWNPEQTSLYEPQFLVERSETCRFEKFQGSYIAIRDVNGFSRGNSAEEVSLLGPFRPWLGFQVPCPASKA